MHEVSNIFTEEKGISLLEEQEVLGKRFRIYGTAENPLFVARDVAEWIEYDISSVNKMIASVDNDEKVRNNVPTLGGLQETWCLTEDGLYEVLMQSRKPKAKQFKKKVKEILKDIRAHGIYATDNVIDNILNNPDFGIELLMKLREERDFAKKKAQYESAYMERYNNHIMTTSNIPDDYNVVKYCGIVSSQIVIGTGMWSEFVASVDDFFGSSTSPFAEKIRKSREILLERIRTESSERGGNAVIGIKFEYVSFENNIIGVMVDGTSVEIEKIKQ